MLQSKLLSQHKIFFRIDDLGWYPQKFKRVLDLFKTYNIKLNAEAIPMSCLENYVPDALVEYKDILQVHCHGFSHLDHQNSGKKAEFGSQRKYDSVKKDLVRGQEILQKIYSDLYFPIFTPPWNRIEIDFITALFEVGFKAISTDAQLDFLEEKIKLPNIYIQMDLHNDKHETRQSPTKIIQDIVALEQTKTEKMNPHFGIMLHHKPMTEDDYGSLEKILAHLQMQNTKTYFMSELL